MILLRILAVIGKELVEMLRRPMALVGIVVGPLLILMIFAIGFAGQPRIRVAVVVPAGTGLPADLAAYQERIDPAISVTQVGSDAGAARALLATGAVDLVVVVPADARTTLVTGHPVTLQILEDTVSPYRAFVAQSAAEEVVQALDTHVLAMAVASAVQAVPGASIPPQLAQTIGTPVQAVISNVAPSAPSLTAFYGLAVLALISQHVGVTLAALGMLRDRRRDTIELLRMSPIRPGELFIGKFIAAAFLTGLVTVIVALALVGLWGVPMLGDPAQIALTLTLLTVAACGLGLVIALLAKSDRQVVQAALLVLLASIFFSGLAIDLVQFTPVVQAAAQVLPVTQATQLLQDLFLRGTTDATWRWGALAAMAVVLVLVGTWRLRAAMAPVR